jgi:hypothetical protein
MALSPKTHCRPWCGSVFAYGAGYASEVFIGVLGDTRLVFCTEICREVAGAEDPTPAVSAPAAPTPMPPATICAWRDDMRASLRMWKEPDGFLVPTEPDPDERERVRARLSVAIEVLGRVLGDAP